MNSTTENVPVLTTSGNAMRNTSLSTLSGSCAEGFSDGSQSVLFKWFSFGWLVNSFRS